MSRSMNCKHTIAIRKRFSAAAARKCLVSHTSWYENVGGKKLRYSLHTCGHVHVNEHLHPYNLTMIFKASSLAQHRACWKADTNCARVSSQHDGQCARLAFPYCEWNTLPNGTITYLHFTMWMVCWCRRVVCIECGIKFPPSHKHAYTWRNFSLYAHIKYHKRWKQTKALSSV